MFNEGKEAMFSCYVNGRKRAIVKSDRNTSMMLMCAVMLTLSAAWIAWSGSQSVFIAIAAGLACVGICCALYWVISSLGDSADRRFDEWVRSEARRIGALSTSDAATEAIQKLGLPIDIAEILDVEKETWRLPFGAELGIGALQSHDDELTVTTVEAIASELRRSGIAKVATCDDWEVVILHSGRTEVREVGTGCSLRTFSTPWHWMAFAIGGPADWDRNEKDAAKAAS